MYGCGADETQNFENKIPATGTYHPTLIFPDDIPRKESVASALTDVECETNRISTIEFTFMVNDSPIIVHLNLPVRITRPTLKIYMPARISEWMCMPMIKMTLQFYTALR
jgi:hypothetical protein